VCFWRRLWFDQPKNVHQQMKQIKKDVIRTLSKESVSFVVPADNTLVTAMPMGNNELKLNEVP